MNLRLVWLRSLWHSAHRGVPPSPERPFVCFAYPFEVADSCAVLKRDEANVQDFELGKGKQWRYAVVRDVDRAREADERPRAYEYRTGREQRRLWWGDSDALWRVTLGKGPDVLEGPPRILRPRCAEITLVYETPPGDVGNAQREHPDHGRVCAFY